MSAGDLTVMRLHPDGAEEYVDAYTLTGAGSAYKGKANARAQAESVAHGGDVVVRRVTTFGDDEEIARYRNGVAVEDLRRERSHESNVALGDSTPADARRPLTASDETTPGGEVSVEEIAAERPSHVSTTAPAMLRAPAQVALAAHYGGSGGPSHAELAKMIEAIVADRLEIRRALRTLRDAATDRRDTYAAAGNHASAWANDLRVNTIADIAVALFGDAWETGL